MMDHHGIRSRPPRPALVNLGVAALVIATFAVLLHLFHLRPGATENRGLPDGTEIAVAAAVVLVGGLLSGIVHVTAHALAIVWYGHRPTVLVVGRSPWLLAVTVRGTQLRLGLLPGAEDVEYRIERPPLTSTQRRSILLAGPVANLVVAAASIAVAVAASPLARLAAVELACLQLGTLIDFLAPAASYPASDAAQLWHLRRYRPAWRLRDQGLLALHRLDFEGAADCFRRALREETPPGLRVHVTLELAGALATLGRFEESADLKSRIAAMISPENPSFATVKRNWADSLLAFAICSDQSLEPGVLAECARWIDVEELTDPAGARLHGFAMLRLMQGRPDEAIEPCRRSLALLDTYQGLASRHSGSRQNITATLVIALGHSGDQARAKELLPAVEPTNPFFAAARAAAGAGHPG